MNLSLIPSDADPRVRAKLDSEADRARDRLADAERAVLTNAAAEAEARKGYAAAEKKALRLEGKRGFEDARDDWDRQWRRYDSALTGLWNALAFQRNARARLEELENPARVAQLARREQEKRERLDELSRRRQEEREASESATDTRVTRVIAETTGRREYPQVVDNGDGLAQMDRERLRALARENGQSVAGHKAVLIERLRQAGVKA